jgi:NAD(P)-dependent dehydrogenase (short-subunit alcohol dehydrogenase family)
MAVQDTDDRPLMVVTGGSRGIGRGIVEKALGNGYRVAVIDVDAEHLDTLQRELATTALRTAIVDITDPAAVDEWLTELVADAGVPAALVNNAGIVRMTRLEDVKVEDWRAMLDVNLTGTFVMTQRVGRHMIAAGGGSIVSIGSTASLAWTVGGSAYPPSKAAVAMLMCGVALEWGAHGIRANTVSPGYTMTPMTAPIFADPERAAPRLARIPVGRFAQPSDIAEVVVFLCSPQAGYLTGQNIVVDGGCTLTALLAPMPPSYRGDQYADAAAK